MISLGSAGDSLDKDISQRCSAQIDVVSMGSKIEGVQAQAVHIYQTNYTGKQNKRMFTHSTSKSGQVSPHVENKSMPPSIS
jgi:hypothetical protein